METCWFLLITLLSISFCTALGVKSYSIVRRRLPPGPSPLPLLGNLVWLPKSFSNLHHVLRSLRHTYGPVATMFVGRRPAVFIMDHTLAHKSLVQKGPAFAHRPPPLGTWRVFSSNVHTINMAVYGPLWRQLRRGLSSEIFRPSRVGLQLEARQWALDALIHDLKSRAMEGGVVFSPSETFEFGLFRLFSLLCFGRKLDDKVLLAIRSVQLDLLKQAVKLSVFNLLPVWALVVFLRRWKKLLDIRRVQDDLMVPLIRAHHSSPNSWNQLDDPTSRSYLEMLLDVKVTEQGGRGLRDEEMVSLCSEFLNASTETTSTALQWIMANLVKHQNIQDKLYEEVKRFCDSREKMTSVESDDISKMPYLKAVVLEGLRRHPPAHFLLPHTVEEDTELERYVIPRGTVVNYTVAELGRDDNVWSEPLAFKPERFLAGGEGEDVDLTGSKEIKMMPFGAGRRVCPGLGVAVFLLEYFVANLLHNFRWEGVAGEEVDLSELPGLTVVMKIPFKARLVARVSN